MRRSAYKRLGLGLVGLLGLGFGGCKTARISGTSGDRIAVVSGDGQAVNPGQPLSQALVVRVTDRDDAPVVGTQVSWSVVLGTGSLGSGVSTTAADGTTEMTFTVGGSPGPERVRASVSTHAGAASVEFSATSIGATWPNNPSTFTTLTDWPFAALSGGGWNVNAGGGATIQTDVGAPLSPTQIGQWSYPPGFTGGGAPQTMYRGLPQLTEIYIGYWWKPSNPWQGHASGINKISFAVATDFSTDLIVTMRQSGAQYFLVVFPGGLNDVVTDGGYLEGNVNNVAVVLGQWHRIELYVKYSTTATSADGIVRWWLDGALVGNYSNASFPGDPLAEFQFSPTWGGTGDTKTEQDYYWFDHVYMSTP